MFNYPKPRKSDFTYELHGVTMADPYQWMEDRHAEETLAWVKAQNEFTDNFFNTLEGYDAPALAKKLKENAKGVSYSEEYELNDKLYCIKTDEASKVYAVVLDMDYKEIETIATPESFDGKYIYSSCIPSVLDNGIVAVNGLEHGKAAPSIVVYDYKNDKVLHTLEGMFSWCWGGDGKTIYFADADIDKTTGKSVHYVKVYNTDTDEITTIHTHNEHSPFLRLSASADGKYIFILAFRDYSNCKLYCFTPADNTTVELTDGDYLSISYLGSNEKYHYIFSRENADFGKIIGVEIGGKIADAKVIIPESEKNLIGAQITPKYILVSSMKDVAGVLDVYSHEGEYVKTVELPDTFGNCGSRNFGSHIVSKAKNFYFSFESFRVAPMTMRYNLETDEVSVAYQKKKVNVPDDIVVEQIFVPSSADGVKIPAFVVHKKDIKLDGNNPVLMFGYGGYRLPVAPQFFNTTTVRDIYDWVNDGFVYVSCNLRGGNEYGTKWHHGGNLGNKKNCYADFISIAEWLIENKWTNPKKLAICGQSNGGLLVTTLITMRPDLWGCVIASVPHTDMIRYMYDDRGPMYTTEYGNPREEKMFHYMKSYSPYHNVKNVNYPPIYIQTGECDNNVPPYHGKKFAALMQEMNTSENPVLLRVLKDGSHDRGRGDALYKTASEAQTFVKKALGV